MNDLLNYLQATYPQHILAAEVAKGAMAITTDAGHVVEVVIVSFFFEGGCLIDAA